MAELKRTPLYEAHVAAGATMVDFGGWEMPVQYPTGIVAEHLFTRSSCSLFDVSHMGRFFVEGPERVAFLQHVLTSNVEALELGMAQYGIISDAQGFAIDDAYLYRFEEEKLLLVVNAANTQKDWDHLLPISKQFDCTLTNVSDEYAAIAVQGPLSRELLTELAGGVQLTEPMKNAVALVELEGHPTGIAKTGYTGEPLGYEVYIAAKDVVWLWNRLIEMGAKPAGLGARDTLRLEACLPLYGHELGNDPSGAPIPICAMPLSRFAVSLAPQKGDFIGREPLTAQREAYKKLMDRDFSALDVLPRCIKPIALIDRGVIRAGMEVYRGDECIGWVTSGTMVPYYKSSGEGLETVISSDDAKRSIGFAYIASDVLEDDFVEVDVRGKRLKAVIVPCHLRSDAPPYARPIIYGTELAPRASLHETRLANAIELMGRACENHVWRQQQCVNLIPSENTPSPAVRALCAADPSGRYAEHRKAKAFYDKDVFYYQGTDFINEVEQLLVDEMRTYFGCTEVETRVISGQMSNMAVFSSLLDWKNRVDRKSAPRRLGYVLNNHIIKGGHLSAQPMGALRDFIATDPATERPAVVNFPVCADNEYKIDVEATKQIIERYRPELIIFGKSMVLHKEPVAAIRAFVDEAGIPTTIMYDMAHVLGILGPSFQNPFEEGAEIVTGSTHKTFFGPQRGVIATNWKEEDLKYGLWETIETRTFPGSVSNHHLGTQLGLLMAAYEMNAFRKEYQSAVCANARSFARACKDAGLDVAGDESIGFTETHQVIVRVGYGAGAEVARRLENNNIIVNYQATPDEEGFTASGALRMGVSEMTRFGFGKAEFERLAELMAACILENKNVAAEVSELRSGYTQMHYCFEGAEFDAALKKLLQTIGL
ncbi:MAG: glycine cleavage system aminomethyltransferase GcvT [Coriobacteriales bacterium]|nr:glycine cleavage system aminomethyltransferase GcvT [Coriobacteriales bacterium]